MSEILPEDAEEGARQSAFRDGFDAADKVHEASKQKDDK